MNKRLLLFRVDSSAEIGGGHLSRCLTFAEVLREEGYRCEFVCRDLHGHGAQWITRRDFQVHLLPRPNGTYKPASRTPAHAAWLGVPVALDAEQTKAVILARKPSWLVVDHYGLDANWDQGVGCSMVKRFVFDDLHDRELRANILLDQGVGATAQLYGGLVGRDCRVLAGSSYAMLRPEFAALRDMSLKRRRNIDAGTLLLTLGGYDADNVTSEILADINTWKKAIPAKVHVVMGGKAPHLDAVKIQCRAMDIQVELHVDTTQIAQLMCQSDIAIGGAGVTALERCVLGLPSITVVMADNQRFQASALNDLGAALAVNLRDGDFLAQIEDRYISLQNNGELHSLSRAASLVADGLGARRVCTRFKKWDRYSSGHE